MNCLAQLQFGAPEWTTIVIATMLVGLALVIYAYRSLSLKRPLTGAAMFLKVCGIAILSIALTEPLWSGVRVHPGTNLFAIVVDDSRSLEIIDSKTGQRASNRFNNYSRPHRQLQRRTQTTNLHSGSSISNKTFRYETIRPTHTRTHKGNCSI